MSTPMNEADEGVELCARVGSSRDLSSQAPYAVNGVCRSQRLQEAGAARGPMRKGPHASALRGSALPFSTAPAGRGQAGPS